MKITITPAVANPVYWKAIKAPYNRAFVESLQILDKGSGPNVWLRWDSDNKVWLFRDIPLRREQLLTRLRNAYGADVEIEIQ